MRVAYIAHPISGDEKENIKKILEIARKINLEEIDVVPFVPYLADVMCLDDTVPRERRRGIKNGHHILESGVVDELRLYGNIITKGMQEEILIAIREDIDIIPISEETIKEFIDMKLDQ